MNISIKRCGRGFFAGRHQGRRRGSVLITAMVLSAVIALCLASYLRLSVAAVNLSQRSEYYQTALSLAEGGVEQAIWSLNNGVGGTWGEEWVVSGDERKGRFSVVLSQNATALITVWVENANPAAGSTPSIVSRASVTPPGGGPVQTRCVKVSIRHDSAFSFGLVGRESVTLNGQPEVDSYKSSLGPYGAFLSDGSSNRFDRGSVGVLNPSNNALSIGNASIWGTASVGAASSSAIGRSNGIIGPFGNSSFRDSAVQTHFSAIFPDLGNPSPDAVNNVGVLGASALPQSGDQRASDGKYYYNITGVSLSAHGDVLTISDNVVLMVSNPLQTVSVSGQGAIAIAPLGSLAIYTPGDVSISGNGVGNFTGSALKMQVISTRVSGSAGAQSINISGNGVLSAIVYAPDATVGINGGGSSGHVFGSMVGRSVALNGSNARFHYDEDLASSGLAGSWTINSWNELATASERAAWDSRLGP